MTLHRHNGKLYTHYHTRAGRLRYAFATPTDGAGYRVRVRDGHFERVVDTFEVSSYTELRHALRRRGAQT